MAVPAIALGVLANDWTAELLAGGLPPIAQKTAADALVFLVPAAIAHLYAALAASGLAAFDSYGTAAAGYALGSVLGLAVILWRVDEDGIIACAWGPLVNGLVALTVPLIGLLLRADWGRRVAVDIGSRFAELARATALPIVLQAFFVVCLRFVSGLGTGSVTSFTYAYFVAAALVAVTASSLGLVSSVPLTRASLSDERASRHVVSTSLVSFAAVAAAAGVFALVGERIVHAALGPDYEGAAGDEIGRLIVLLGPWMAVSIGVTITFPMLFVANKARRLPLLAIGALLLDVVADVDGRRRVRAGRCGAGADSLDARRARQCCSCCSRRASWRRAAVGSRWARRRSARSRSSPSPCPPGCCRTRRRPSSASRPSAALLVAVRDRGLQQAWSYLRTLD